DGQLERLCRTPREVEERNEPVPLAVAEPLSANLYSGAPPVRHGSKRARRIRAGIRPCGKKDTWRCLLPAHSTGRKQCPVLTYGLDDREVQVMGGETNLSLADPDLRQARVNIHQCRPRDALHCLCRHVAVEVQQKISFVRRCLEIETPGCRF